MLDTEFELLFLGRGGQGAFTAARLLGRALLKEGYQVLVWPSFGPERRGAPVQAFLRAGKKELKNRSPVTKPLASLILDASLEAQAPSEGLKLVADKTEPGALQQEAGTRLIRVPALSLAKEYLGTTHLNTVMLGALAGFFDFASPKAFEEALSEEFSDPGRQKQNNEALKAAWAWAQTLSIEGFGARQDLALAETKAETLSLPHEERAGLQTNGRLSEQADFQNREYRSSESLKSPQNQKPAKAFYLAEGPAMEARRPASNKALRTQKPLFDPELCTACGLCSFWCPDAALANDPKGRPILQEDWCKGCGICARICPKKAVSLHEE